MAICKAAVVFLIVAWTSSCQAALTNLRWCTISTHEQAKCVAMKDAFAAQSLSPPIVCVVGDGIPDCYEEIRAGRADLITLDGGDVYTAGKEYDLVPIIQEVYAKDTYNGIAVVKKDRPSLSINTLAGMNSCHTGIRRTAGWNIPVGYLLDSGSMTPTDCGDDINAVANFFNQSCAPGAFTQANDPYGTNPASLCGICTNPACPPDSTELYQSYAGAFRCLAEGQGDVAFIKPATILENTDGMGTEDWNRNLVSADFRLLCPDGRQDTVPNQESCNLAKSPAHATVTRADMAEADVQEIQTLLQRAVALFGADDNPNNFFLFDSTAYGGRDLLFKDTAQDLRSLDLGLTYRTYLGTYADTIDGLKRCPAGSLRWCTISASETQKCRAMSAAFEGEGITPKISCYEESNKGLCIDRIFAGDADVVTLDGGDLYTGGREDKIVPVAGETYSATGMDDDASYWAVAVARKGTNFQIDDLAQRQSCHTGIGKTSGWNVPVGHLIKIGQISVDSGCDVPKAVGEFFSAGSCAPGAKTDKYDPEGTNPSSLCSQCIGTGNDNCVRNSAEPYYDYAGAFRCLAEEAGDVAFVKHTTVVENTDGNGTLAWNSNLRSSDYELLCPDNTRMPISSWRDCNLAKVPSHAVVTSISKTAEDQREIYNVLERGQTIFGSDSGTGFKMFDSAAFGGSNLLFKDSTMSLVDVGERNTFEKWLSDEYVEDLEALYCDTTGGASPLAQPATWLLLGLVLVQAVWTRAMARE